MGLLAAETGVQEQPAAHNAGQEVQLAGVLTKFHVAVDHQDEDEQNEVERQHGSQKLHLQVENIPMDGSGRPCRQSARAKHPTTTNAVVFI